MPKLLGWEVCVCRSLTGVESWRDQEWSRRVAGERVWIRILPGKSREEKVFAVVQLYEGRFT
jgi:hypothetical protein